MIDCSLDIRRPIILIGAGGHAKVIVDCLARLEVKAIAYFARQKSEWLERMGVAYIDEIQLSDFASSKAQMVISYIGGRPEKLESRFQEMKNLTEKGAVFPSIIHPGTVLSQECYVGMGVQVLAGSVINANAKLDDGCIVNSNATIEHDALIGRGVHIAPNATILGEAQVGDYAYIGSSSVLIQKSIVQKRSFVKSLSLHQSNE